jgi:hypothetical protein
MHVSMWISVTWLGPWPEPKVDTGTKHMQWRNQCYASHRGGLCSERHYLVTFLPVMQ